MGRTSCQPQSRSSATFRRQVISLALTQNLVCLLHGTYQNIQTNKDEINIRNRDCYFTGNDEASIQNMIERFQKRDIGFLKIGLAVNCDLVER